jgi:hypothetical protein
MRYYVVGAAMAAVAAGVLAQGTPSPWRYFEPAGQPMQAGVVNADGAQLILKCDKPGKKSVYAVMVNPQPLVPPRESPFLLPTEVRFDENAPQEDRWRFYQNSAVAIDMRGQLALTRFMVGLPTASKLRLRMYVERGRTVEVSFDVGGAQEAIRRVYESCQDDVPTS